MQGQEEMNLKLYDQQDSFGNTPMHMACMAGKVECLKLLIQQGASIQIDNNEGFTPSEISQILEIRYVFNHDLDELT